MIDALRLLATDEDFVADVGWNWVAHGDSEWEDRAFNAGVEAARAAIVERINPARILVALEGLKDHRQHVSINFPEPGICVKCFQIWPCEVGMALDILESKP